MKQNPIALPVVKSRLKLYIAAHCRSDMPVRNKGMEILAKQIGVYTNPRTIEGDLFAYVDQLDSPSEIDSLFCWNKILAKDGVIDRVPSLPQFQLELI